MAAGCAGPAGGAGTAGSQAGRSGDRLQVVTTIFPQYDFARQIAGDCADVSMLLKPGEEVHSYEPTPLDIKTIQHSDLFIYTGGENDVWVESILASLGEDGPRAVRMLDLVEVYAEEPLEGMMPERGGHDHAHKEAGSDAAAEEDGHVETETGHGVYAAEDTQGDEDGHDHGRAETETGHYVDAAEDTQRDSEKDGHAHGQGRGHSHLDEPDEHVWTSPENCVRLVEKLTEAFCLADPAHEAAYRENGGRYREAFVRLDREYREMADSASRKTILFGDRFPFRYLAQELGLTCYAAFSGCSSESEPSAATVAFLIDKAAAEELPVVFKIEFSNGNIAQAVCEAAQLRRKKSAAEEGSDAAGANRAAGAGAGRTADAGEAAGTGPNGAAGAGGTTGAGGAQDPQMQVLQLHSCHNVTRDEYASGETCLSLMEKNLEALRIALGAGGQE